MSDSRPPAPPAPTAPRSASLLRSRLRITLLGVACVAFGLLIWSRLLLVTSYPKTAIAEPQADKAAAAAKAE